MKLRTVAVYQNDKGEIQEVTTSQGSRLYDYKMETAKELEKDGYKLISCVITTDRKLYFKMRLKSALSVLRNTQEYYNRYLEERMGFFSDDILAETQRLQDEYIEHLMNRVGRLCARCIREEIEVTDELALMCCDFRERNRSWN